MNKTDERLNAIIKRKDISMGELSRLTGIPKTTISRYLNDTSNIPADRLSIIANALNTTPGYLMGWEDKSDGQNEAKTNEGSLNLIEIPLYTSISCGNGCFVEDNIEDYIKVTDKMLNPHKQYFCQYAKGDSMINENIDDGDLLVFEITQSINNGQVGCFCVEHGDAVCKKFYHDKERGTVILQSANNEYSPIIITPKHEEFKVVGKLVLVINSR